jgi:hypothetical protein
METALKQKAEIVSGQDYMLIVPPEGLDFWEIVSAVGKLFPMGEFQLKNAIWLFREGPVDFLYDDLFKLKAFIENHFPANAKGKKTAIVAGSYLQRKMALAYAKICRDMPCRLKVFTDIKSAEAWIRE